jgi:hypothetical protein
LHEKPHLLQVYFSIGVLNDFAAFQTVRYGSVSRVQKRLCFDAEGIRHATLPALQAGARSVSQPPTPTGRASAGDRKERIMTVSVREHHGTVFQVRELRSWGENKTGQCNFENRATSSGNRPVPTTQDSESNISSISHTSATKMTARACNERGRN